MTDFLETENAIKDYIKEKLPALLEEMELDNFDGYIEDFLDLDKYAKSKQLFFDFNTYSYDYLTNESENETIDLNIYLTFMKDKPSSLITKMKKYTAALIELFKRSNYSFEGIVDFGKYDSVQFYLAPDGTPDVKISNIHFILTKEQ